MIYALVDNGLILKTGPRPKWTVDGEPVSDDVLRAGGFECDENGEPLRNPDGSYVLASGLPGWYPVAYEPPAHDPYLQRVVLNPHQDWVIEPMRVVATYDIVEIPLSDAIATARQSAHDRINAEYEQRVRVLAEGYPESEQQSWPVQIREADIVLGDDVDPTPWIDAAAPARGITRVALATLIKAQDTAYRQYHGALTGIRQMLRDMIDNVPDGPGALETLNSINWPEE